jgi:lysozyme family protein
MADFEAAYSLTMWNEWGSSGSSPYEDDPDDEPTGYGLVESDFVEARAMGLVGADVNPRNVTAKQAEIIGHRLYWDRLRLDSVRDQTLANKWFDMSYPMGVCAAAERMQEALNDIGQNYILVDGVVGPKTLGAVDFMPPSRLLARFKVRCAEYYEDIADRHPDKRQFLKGWLDRVAA